MGLFKKEEASGLRLICITTFNCSLNKKFFKLLQDKLGFDDALMERIQKVFVANIICKIEYYEDSSGESFERAKVWETIGGNTSYYEIDDPFYMGDRAFYFWGTKFWELLTEQEDEIHKKVKSLGVAIAYDPPMRSFIMHIDGGDERFMKPDDAFVPKPLAERVKEDGILLQVKPYDFVWLKDYDDSNDGADSPDDPMYYLPTDKYRRWSNWKTKGARDKFKSTGMRWALEIHDFANNILPKLENK